MSIRPMTPEVKCAEMRSVLRDCWRNPDKNDPRIQFRNKRIDHALSSDCGKGCVRVSELAPTIQWLRFLVPKFSPLSQEHKLTLQELARLEKLVKEAK